MATSRTGTGTWKRLRAAAIKQHIREGIGACRKCGVMLDYDTPQLPNSAEADHIVPYSQAGQDVIGNIEIICRLCNQRKGDGTRKRPRPAPVAIEPTTSVRW